MNKKFEHGKRYLFKHEIEETIKATAMIIGVHGSQRFFDKFQFKVPSLNDAIIFEMFQKFVIVAFENF